MIFFIELKLKGLELEVKIKQRSFFLPKRKTVRNERMTEKKEREDKEENAATEAKLDRRSQHAPCWWNDIGATNTLAPKKVGA